MKKLLNFRKNKLSYAKQYSLFKNLARLTAAHIPIAEALSLVAQTTKNKKEKALLQALEAHVAKGISLSKSLNLIAFSKSNIIHLVTIGEKSGELPLMLGKIASYINASVTLRRKIISAFVYPCIIGIATIGFTLSLVLFIFPKIIPIFTTLHVKLPISTRIVIVCVYFFTHYSLYAIAFSAFLSFAIWFYVKRHEKIKLSLVLLILKIPLLGKIIRIWNCAEFSRTLGTLLNGGGFLPESVFISTYSLLLPYKTLGLQYRNRIERGDSLSSILSNQEFLFPSPTAHIIAVGEKSGELAGACNDLAQMSDEQIDNYVKTLTQLIEPLLMIFMGIVVGFVALSIITPIYAITQNIH